MSSFTSRLLAALALTLPATIAAADYTQGFEVDISGWDVFGGAFDAVRVPSGTNGIVSADGAFHAEVDTAAGNWGGYGFNPGCASTGCAAASFPTAGYETSVDIYLDVTGGWANNTRFDLSSAVNKPDGSHQRDFIFNAGFYNDTDGSPGSGTDRFIVSASTNSQPGSAFAKNPAMDPIAISTSGWYTFTHTFANDGSGVLEVTMTIHDSGGGLVHTWVRSDPLDVLNSTVGGNRYGWFDYNEFSTLAIDNAALTVFVAPVINVDTAEEFLTIQEAIDDADTLAGHTLEVQVAEHVEGPQIVVNKSLTLRGSGGTVVKAAGSTTTSGDGRGWFLVDPGVVLHVEDLAFDGNGFLIWQAFRQKGSGSFTNCSFTDIKYQVSGSPYAGNAIAAFGDGPVHVSDCAMSDIGRHGLFYFGTGVSGSTCTNLTYTGKGDGDWIDYGIEVSAGAVADISDSTVTDCRGVAVSDGSTSAGILATTFFGPGTTATITGSTLTANTTGLFAGYDASDTSLVEAHFNNIASNTAFGVRNTSSTEIVDATENWWGDANGPHDPGGVMPAVNGACAPVEVITNTNPSNNEVDDENVEYCSWAELEFARPEMGTLLAEVPAGCLDDGQISVEIWMRDLNTPTTGFQAFLAFDDATLLYRGDLSSYTSSPFPLHVQPIGTADVDDGELRLDGSASFGGPGTVQDSLLATLVFDVLVPCSTTSVDFDLTQSFDSELSFEGAALPTTLVGTPAFTLDSTPPVLDPCPADIVQPADAGVGGGCTGAVVTFAAPLATDNCDGPLVAVCTPPSGSLFPIGTTEVTCTATDACGNESSCTFDVEVTATNLIDVEVDLVGVFVDPATRCIRFVTDDCDNEVHVEIDFLDHDANAGTAMRAIATIEVDCGVWTSLCAKDEQHTQWDTVPLVLSGDGTRYETTTALLLTSGDTDNDGDVDINDVTWLVFTFGSFAADGDCAWDGTRDADFDNDGAVGSNDYTLLSDNWLTLTSCACALSPAPAGKGDGMSISVSDLAPAVAAAADFDGNGVVDHRDIAIFEAVHGLSGDLSRRMAPRPTGDRRR